MHEPLPQTCLIRQTSELTMMMMMRKKKNLRQNAAGSNSDDSDLISKNSCCVWSTVRLLIAVFVWAARMSRARWLLELWALWMFEKLFNSNAFLLLFFWCLPAFVVAAWLHFPKSLRPSLLWIFRPTRCQAMAVLLLVDDFAGCRCEAVLCS